ncbi:MAG: recombinase family protein, partial [Defluviitaleaceae bacterium]|nr:recombinase family protein [Defluviitaleaceae bacterium]
QLKLIRDYAHRHNLVLSEIYSDEGISGRKADKRPAFKRMIADAAKKAFQAILIYNTSRFARNHEESIVYRNMLHREGIEVISITQPSVDYKTDILMNALYAVMDERYSIELSENVKRGMKEKVSRGMYISCAPLGYVRKEKNKPLIIHEEESRLVHWIFNEYAGGGSMYAMAKTLNDMGHRAKRGNPFDRRGILRILTNPIYKGYVSWTCDGDTIYMRADHEPIIDEATFEKVQSLINERKKTKVHKVRDSAACSHWLAGLIRCPVCGTTYVYAKGYRGMSDRCRCGRYSNASCTNNHSIKVSTMESIVLEYLTNLPAENILYTKTESRSRELENNAKSSIDRLEKALERAKQAFLQGIDTIDEYKHNKANISSEIERLKSSLQVEPSHTGGNKTAERKIRGLLDILQSDSSAQTKNAVARSIIYKIVANPSSNTFDFYFFS